VRLDLVEQSHVRVLLKLGEVNAHEMAQLRHGVRPAGHRGAEPVEHLLRLEAEEVHQDVVFALEIEVDGPVRDPGFFGHFGDRRDVEPLAGENLHGRFENAVVLGILRVGGAHAHLNEFLFIRLPGH